MTSRTCDKEVYDHFQIKRAYMYLLMIFVVVLIVFVCTLFARANRSKRFSNKNQNTGNCDS